MFLPGLGGHAFNAKVDADSIMATLARKNGTTLRCNGGVQFAPYDGVVVRRDFGEVMMDSGLLQPVSTFFKLTPWQVDYAQRLVKFLNYEMGHDGSWAVLWLNPTIDGYATEIRMAYQDVDGDVQFVVESDRTLVDLQSVDDVSSHGNNCNSAYVQWKQWMDDVDVQKNQTIKAAQGQQQLDPTVTPLL